MSNNLNDYWIKFLIFRHNMGSVASHILVEGDGPSPAEAAVVKDKKMGDFPIFPPLPILVICVFAVSSSHLVLLLFHFPFTVLPVDATYP